MEKEQIEQLKLLIVAYNQFIFYATEKHIENTFDNFMHWLSQNYKDL